MLLNKKWKCPIFFFSFLCVVTAYYNLYSLLESSLLDDVNQLTFKMENCPCTRTIRIDVASDGEKDEADDVAFSETTCGVDAFRRGRNQKVVVFAFYGDINSTAAIEKGYYEGIAANLNILPIHYPGWIMRLYHNFDKSSQVFEEICKLACSNSNLDICDAANLPGNPMKDATKAFERNWRLFPTVDPQVDISVSRDTDSLFNDRETAAVNEWLQSDKDFHLMRDHPLHGTTILAGMWGTKLTNTKVRKHWIKALSEGMKDPLFWTKEPSGGPDQRLMTSYVWPWCQKYLLSHDSYLCSVYPKTQPFPTERKDEPNNFVGSVVKQNQYMWNECPEQCRPADHKDWLRC